MTFAVPDAGNIKYLDSIILPDSLPLTTPSMTAEAVQQCMKALLGKSLYAFYQKIDITPLT